MNKTNAGQGSFERALKHTHRADSQKPRAPSKLRLEKETIRKLTEVELGQVAGGFTRPSRIGAFC
jgi:hypothetical protein